MAVRRPLLAPRHLLGLFAGIAIVLASALVWLGSQLVRQDRALERERGHETLTRAATTVTIALQERIAAAQASKPMHCIRSAAPRRHVELRSAHEQRSPPHFHLEGDHGDADARGAARHSRRCICHAARRAAPRLLLQLSRRGRLAPTADAVCLRVRDSGPGIPSEMHERIFEPFKQLEGRPADSDGVGLGLAISRTLARASGDDVTVESAPGDGATFIVNLPRAV